MYFVWNLQDCFFRALAARYWAFVPCRQKKKRRTGDDIRKQEKKKSDQQRIVKDRILYKKGQRNDSMSINTSGAHL